MLQRLLTFLPAPLRSLLLRFDKTPITSIDGLSTFLQTRSAYVAQTSLYGYLKTRMGTQFRSYFEDEVFSTAIRDAAVRLFASCLSDLTVFTVGTVAVKAGLTAVEAETLAKHCYATALNEGLKDLPIEDVPEIDGSRFADRCSRVTWTAAPSVDEVFSVSAEDLVRFAPVIDQFKELDREIVTNSIRFRWVDIRKQVADRMDADALARSWRTAQPGEAPGEKPGETPGETPKETAQS